MSSRRSRLCQLIIVCRAFACGALAAGAAPVLRVGPGEAYGTPSAAARAAHDGDTVEIAAGVYRGDACAWTANDLTIRGAGPEATILAADGACCRGKGTWVITGTNVTVSGVAFTGARCADRNGAGIRFEGDGPLVVRDCLFRKNENGILTGALPAATVTIDGCRFHDNGSGDGFSHNLYIGAIRKLIFRASRSSRANGGHALKSRAHETVIEGCVFDETEGAADGSRASSYLVNCPNGGRVTLRACTLHQSADAANGTLVAIGEEGACAGTRFINEDNRFVNDRAAGGEEVRLVGVDAHGTVAERLQLPTRETMGATNIIPLQDIDAAAWIWSETEPTDDEMACVRFRKAFVSDGTPVVLDVSADERFVLRLDGEFVGRGPHRGFVDHWNYQTYRLTPTPGTHVLEATVVKLGRLRPAAQTTYRAGFILKASGSYDDELTTGKAAWRAADLRGTAISEDATSETLGLVGPTFRVLGASWLDEQPADEAFRLARVVRGPIVKGLWGERTRGWMLFPSALPDQRETVRQPGRFVAGEDAGAAAFDALLSRGDAVTVPAHAEVRLLWDLGDYFCAYPELTVSGGAGAEMSWAWDESLRTSDGRKGDRSAVAGKAMTKGFTDTFIADGRTRAVFTTPWWRAGRWCELVVRTKEAPLVVSHLAIRETRYPLEVTSSFRCDDPELAPIADLCRRTMENCSHETLCDCPHWEQLMYEGDTRVELQILSSLTSDERLRRTAIALFDQSRRNDGLPAMAVPLMEGKDSSTYALCWVMMFGDYATWGTDAAWLKAHLPGMRATLDGIGLYEDADGLVSDLPGWNYVDERLGNYGVPPGGLPGEPPGALVNLQYLQALQAAAAAEAAVGETALAARWREKAERTASSIRSRFGGRFATAHEVCLAVLTGVTGPDGYETAAAQLADFKRAGFGPMGTYFQYYLFEAAFKLGRPELFFAHLEPWRKMLAVDLKTATENGLTECRSDCHAWSASPQYFFQTGLAGIRPVAPFWSAVEIAPQPGPLHRLTSDMPTPRGMIRLDLTFAAGGVTGTVVLPEGLPAEFVWKGRRVRLSSGENNL